MEWTTNSVLLSIILITALCGVWQLILMNVRMESVADGLRELYKRVDAHSDAIKEHGKMIRTLSRGHES